MQHNKSSTLLNSSNEEPDLQWTAPRAPLQSTPNITKSERYEYIRKGVAIQRADREFDNLVRRFKKCGRDSPTFIRQTSSPTEEELAGQQEDAKILGPVVRGERLQHDEGNCNHLSVCEQCLSLKKVIKMMRKVPNRSEDIVEHYFVMLGRMSTNKYCTRMAQDRLTYERQQILMQSQLTRGFRRYKDYIKTTYRTAMLRAFMCITHDNKESTIERNRLRDIKYESKFDAQGLGPIEHGRGDCDEHWSMCDDCVSIHKCYTISKSCEARTNAAYALFWRIIERSPPAQAKYLTTETIKWLKVSTLKAIHDMLRSYYMYSEELGPNYQRKSEIISAINMRKEHLEGSSSRTSQDLGSSNPYLRENRERPFEAQALASIDFNCPSLDRVTDMLNRLITDHNIGVDVSVWARRMTSFVLMLMQLCADSTLFIKMTAVAQFMTHFNLPGLSSFRGYAQRLAQVFKNAIEMIHGNRRQPPVYGFNEQLDADMDDPEDEDIYDESNYPNMFHGEQPFAAQNDGDPKPPEGLLVGTAKLFCAMAGITDYDVKINGSRIARIDQLSRTIVSTERLAQFIGKLFRYAYDAAMVHVFGTKPDMKELAMVSEAIPKWMDDVSNFYNDNGMTKATKNVSDMKQIAAWLKQGDQYNALLWKFKVLPKAYAVFKNVYNMCDKMYQASIPFLTDSAMRVSPFTIMLTGGPGLGKSVLQYILITDIMTRVLAERGEQWIPGKDLHVHMVGGKFWDGFHEQKVTSMDDIFQSKDPVETIQQCMDICRMKNMVSWPVPKADLASKGNTYMVSELLLLTGNAGIPHDIVSGIRSFDAIRRRIDMLVTVHVTAEYLNASGRLDSGKVRAKFPTTYVDGMPVAGDITPVFRFDIANNQCETILKSGTYQQFLDLALSMKAWEKDHEEGVIRLNYLRSGLNVYGGPKVKEEQYVAQMWRAPTWTNLITNARAANEPDYQGDLLFEADVHAIAQMLRPQLGDRHFPREGFLSPEERIEIFAAIAQERTADPSWTAYMKDIYNKLVGKTCSVSSRFIELLSDCIDVLRKKITDSMLFKVGAVVTLAISIVTLGLLSYKMFRTTITDKEKEDVSSLFAEISGDEQTRQVRTVFAEISGDEKTRQVRTQFVSEDDRKPLTKQIHGKSWVAVKKTSSATTWVPEGKLKNRKPLMVNDVLWQDDESDLPHDLMSSKDSGEIVAQACPDRNAYNIGVCRVTNNAVVAHAYNGGQLLSKLRGLFVYGRVLMLPNHFFFGIDETSDIEIVNSHGLSHKFKLNECQRKTPSQDMDITFLHLPKRFQCYTDIRSHFHSMASLNKYMLSEAMLWVIDGENNGKMIALCDNIAKDTVLQYKVVSHDVKQPDGVVRLVRSYVYRGVTLAGYCGAPLIWLNASLQGGHILGIHVAGSDLRGVTTPITSDFLYEFLRDWNDISIVVPKLDPNPGVMVAQSKRAVYPELGLAHYGRVSARNQVRLPSNTTIIRSALYGVFEPTTVPALLTPTKELNPLRFGILKQKVPLVLFDQELVDEATRHLANAILSVDSPYKSTVCVLTASEALNGFAGDKWIPPMNLHTSPGYPYINSNTSRNGKFDFVTGEPGERELHEYVKERLDERIQNGRDRTVQMTLFMDILKDERVKIQKRIDGKTRIFNVAPFDLNVATRMYFQKFAAHLMHNHVYGECAVGLNAHSDEWGMMYHHMHHLGENWIGGDYSNYDKQLSYQLLKAVLTIIDQFYQDENNNIRECLFETMFSAFHIAERDVYRVPQGNPSGIVMTSLINSLVNSLMMRLVYMELGGSLTTFDDNVRIKTYGDDNIGVVSDAVPWFNMVSISKQFATHGIVYNQPNKEAMDENRPYMTETEMTFLKRGFRHDNGRILAPLSIESIQEMVNWIRESNDDDAALCANFLAAARELFHHGREKFTEFTQHVYREAHNRSFKLPYTDYVTSGEYWGAERSDHLNSDVAQTAHHDVNCCDLENEEAIFIAQSERAPRKIKAVWRSMRDLLILALIINSTSIEPNETTTSSDTMQDNVGSRNEITSFTDTSVVSNVAPQYVPAVPHTPIDPYMKQELTAWLARTYYQTFDWSSASGMGELLLSIRFPNFLLSVVPIWDKLKNFTYFRAGVKIGIRLNGSKFHFGQLLVSYSPQFNNTGDLAKATNNIYSASGCPCFTISASENEVHEFELPYALPYPTIPLYEMSGFQTRPQFDVGVVNVYVLNPLANATGPTTISWTIFANFVDVDVAGYQAIAYTIPTRVINTQATTPAILPGTPSAAPADPVPDPLPPPEEEEFVAQGLSAEQRVKSERRIISGVMDAVSTVAGALTVVPGLSTVASGVATVAGGGAKIARYFGYTNPISLIANSNVIQRYGNISNTHGLNDAANLTVIPEAIVSSSTELLGGDSCEMEILHIAQTPSLLAAGIAWDASQTPSQTIWLTPVVATAEYNTPTLAFPTLLSFVTRSCLFWRGSIRYHMQITCSQMHVGRLRISYQPYVLGGNGQLTADQLANLPSLIVDVQQQASISFTIPYLMFKPWCDVGPPTSPSGRFTGWLRISVLNVLNHPAIPVPPVYINVWTSAGPDFQLSRPELSNTRQGIYFSATDDEEEPPEEFVAQGLSRDQIKALPAPTLIPASGSLEHNICNADEVHHLKDMIMRPGRVTQNDAYGGPAQYSTTYLQPFAPIGNPLIPNSPSLSFRDYFRMIFRYSRGGMRYGFYRTLIGQNWDDSTVFLNGYNTMFGVPVAADWFTATPIISVLSYIFLSSTSNGALFSTNTFQPAIAVLPYYSDMYGITNAVSLTNAPPVSGLWYVNGTLPSMRAGLRYGGVVWNAAADDHELVYLVGPPATLR